MYVENIEKYLFNKEKDVAEYMPNYIFLTGREKKFLVYMLDYFFKQKYSGLRNIVFKSLYSQREQHNLKEK